LLRWPLGTALRGLFAAVAVSCHAHSPSLAKSSTHGGSLTRNYIQLLLFKCVWASFAKLLCPTGALGTKTRFIFIRTAIVVWWYVSGGCWLGSTPHLLTCYEMLLASFNCTHVLRVLRSTRDEKKTEKKTRKTIATGLRSAAVGTTIVTDTTRQSSSAGGTRPTARGGCT
jgi:hypothetical protein